MPMLNQKSEIKLFIVFLMSYENPGAGKIINTSVVKTEIVENIVKYHSANRILYIISTS